MSRVGGCEFVHLVDEAGRQKDARLKIEEVRTPAEVVAGAPFPVHYRVGNVGGGELPDDGSRARLYVVGSGVFDLLGPDSGIWDAGVAYHTSDDTASASSTAIDDVTPFEATLYQYGCRPGPDALRGALEAAGVANIDELLALDAEMRFVRPVHGLAIDGAFCAAREADQANTRLLRRLSIGGSTELRELLAPQTATAPAPEPYRLRIIARLGDDGRIEHGVELSSGSRILPPERFLPADAPTGTWQLSGEVEVWRVPIGKIRARRQAGGRVEMGFISADGRAITPDIAYLPADAPEGVWFRSSEIAVPAAPMMSAGGSPDG